MNKFDYKYIKLKKLIERKLFFIINNFYFSNNIQIIITRLDISVDFSKLHVYILTKDMMIVNKLNKNNNLIRLRLINQINYYKIINIAFFFDFNVVKSINVIDLIDKI